MYQENYASHSTQITLLNKYSFMYFIEQYKSYADKSYKVLIFKIENPEQVLHDQTNSIYEALLNEGLDGAVGLYFYRFEKLSEPKAFSKIGEVSSKKGVISRKKRGWLGTLKYSDTYLNKTIHAHIKKITTSNPMYFVFYEFDIQNAFPKIDEMAAFKEHDIQFSRSTHNTERINTFYELGQNLVWYPPAFSEVFSLKTPSGKNYEECFNNILSQEANASLLATQSSPQ